MKGSDCESEFITGYAVQCAIWIDLLGHKASNDFDVARWIVDASQANRFFAVIFPISREISEKLILKMLSALGFPRWITRLARLPLVRLEPCGFEC